MIWLLAMHTMQTGAEAMTCMQWECTSIPHSAHVTAGPTMKSIQA